MEEIVKILATNRSKIADLDAELNGGALVEVANVLGEHLYIRVPHNDYELARQKIDKLRTFLPDVIYPTMKISPKFI